MKMYDIAIVGAGIVGCAIARELSCRFLTSPIRILVLEQHERPGEETSGRNSGVLHSGIHEPPFSLKEKLAREGCRLAAAYALEHDVPLLRAGMIIAVSWEDIRRGLWRDISMLKRLFFNAWRTKTEARFMTASDLRACEPSLHACCGIAIPSVSVVDSQAFVRSLRTESEATGAEFLSAIESSASRRPPARFWFPSTANGSGPLLTGVAEPLHGSCPEWSVSRPAGTKPRWHGRRDGGC